MSSDKELRRVLKAAGEDVPARGQLRDHLRIRGEQLLELETAGDGADIGDGVSEAGFPDGDGQDDEAQTAAMMPAEARPHRTRAKRRGPFARRAKPATRKARRPVPPRVPVDHLISMTWQGLARAAEPASVPLSRCLAVQSPVAGMILEDTVRDTVVDRALQPLARAEDKGRRVLALAAPPVLVYLLDQTQQLDEPQASMRQAVLLPMLKESLRLWVEIAGPKVEEAARREKEYKEEFGDTIDGMIEMMFEQSPAQTWDEATREPDMAGAAV